LKYLTFDVKQSEQVETSLRSLTKLLWTQEIFEKQNNHFFLSFIDSHEH